MEEIGMEIKANTSLDQENKAQTTNHSFSEAS